MNRDKITIENGIVSVPASAEIWMTQHQLADLFQCFVGKINANVRTILKTGVLDEANVCRTHYYKNGNSVEEIKKQIDDVRNKARLVNRQVKIGVNAFIIARDTEEEAKTVLNEIIAQANVEAVNAFGDATREAGAAAPEREGNWATSTFDDLVQYNDGFKTNLIGTPQQIAERIVALKNIGVDLVLSGFLHFIEEVEYFGEKVLPLVRQLEQQQDIQLEEKSA